MIWAANQPDWVAAMFGTFIAGGVAVPLDVRSTREFVERVVGRTEPVVAFAGRQQALCCASSKCRCSNSRRSSCRSTVGWRPPLPAMTSRVIFTSGTTGDPKGDAQPPQHRLQRQRGPGDHPHQTRHAHALPPAAQSHVRTGRRMLRAHRRRRRSRLSDEPAARGLARLMRVEADDHDRRAAGARSPDGRHRARGAKPGQARPAREAAQDRRATSRARPAVAVPAGALSLWWRARPHCEWWRGARYRSTPQVGGDGHPRGGGVRHDGMRPRRECHAT